MVAAGKILVLSWFAGAVDGLQIFECVTLAEILSNTWWHVVQVWVIIDQEQVWYPHWGTTQFGFLQDWDILSVNNFGFKTAKISGCAAVGYQENSVERSSKEFGYDQIINQVGNVLPYNTHKKCISIFF